MLDNSEKKELLDKLNSLRDETRVLREEMNKLNSMKEETFLKKSEVIRNIREMITKVKETKGKRDEKTKAVKEEKEKRQKLNEEIKEKIQKIAEVNPKVEEAPKKSEEHINPHLIKKNIQSLEYKIETEGMSFEKEKKTMKLINSLKKQLVEAEKRYKAYHELKNAHREIKPLKKDANEIHHKIQEDAGESQKLHEEMIKTSKSIDGLRKEEKELTAKFLEEKKTYQEVSQKLKDKLDALSKISEELNRHKVEAAEERKEKQHKTLKEKQREVEEKMKKGGKLTTDDILVLQGMDN